MPVETITREGDFVLKGGVGVMLRVHADEDAFTITLQSPHSLTFAIDEAEELRDWLTRRLTETIG